MSKSSSQQGKACLEIEDRMSPPNSQLLCFDTPRTQRVESSSPRLATGFSGIKLSSENEDRAVASEPPQSKVHTFAGASLENEGHIRKENHQKPESRTVRQIRQISAFELSSTLHDVESSEVLIVDLRSAAQYKTSRIAGAINIAIPPILLKRPMYTIEKMTESLDRSDRVKLLAWSSFSYVVIYDSDSFNVGPGTNLSQIASKFIATVGSGEVMLLKGGFNAVLRDTIHLVDSNMVEIAQRLEKDNQDTGSTPLRAFGGLACADLAQSSPINPFYNNIRQNQDLIGGVGEPIPLQIPSSFLRYRHRIPRWLRDIVEDPHGPRRLAAKFLKIEQEEQQRMQSVLDAGASGHGGTDQVRHSVAAGVERGDKNRYNNIWPFENARVRLKIDKDNRCEYINASHLHARSSDKFYIATQGPLPGTTKDFWQMIWENKIRTIVMLTRTVEDGQTKCHTYWDQAEPIHPYHRELLEENELLVGDPNGPQISFTTRRILLGNEKLEGNNRNRFREITQIQFADWPDFHIIQPEAILALITEVEKAESPADAPATKRYKSAECHIADIAAPVLSHCSAGCGRTGVFCTVDTVTGLIRRQLESSDADPNQYIEDLVEATVRDFRDQRISMVQT